MTVARLAGCIALVALLAGCDQVAETARGETLVATVAIEDAGPRLVSLTLVGSPIQPADRWGQLYYEVRDVDGRLLAARDIDAPLAGRMLSIPIPLRERAPTQLELFSLDLDGRTPAKRSLGRLPLVAAPSLLARR